MNDQQLLRYSRHILLPEIGIEGQDKIASSHALVIGAGGLGSPAAMFLAASGIGQLTLVDGDQVDLTNLQRQLLHRSSSIGKNKVDSARETLSALNPDISIQTIAARADEKLLMELTAAADVVLDCSDNFATRYALNRCCHNHRKPLVSGAAIRFEGQISVFDFRNVDCPCYNCLYPEQHEAVETRCAVMGVFSPMVGIIGAMQAGEALKVVTGTGSTLFGRLLLLECLHMQMRTLRLLKDPDCNVCRDR